jgi:hypothetical protein
MNNQNKKVEFVKEKSVIRDENTEPIESLPKFAAKYARLRYGNNQEILFNIESQVIKI